jgi:glutamate-ammonia-ligase adenylyltransferase
MTNAVSADPSATRALARLRGASPEIDAALADPADAGAVGRIAQASDFAIDTLVRQPALLLRLLADHGATPAGPPQLHPDQRGEWPRLLRRYRAAESTG